MTAKKSTLDGEVKARTDVLNACNGCVGYANQAVDQAKANVALDCRWPGDRWGLNFEGHFQYCQSAKKSSTDNEVKHRTDDLKKCRDCHAYATNALVQRKKFYAAGCAGRVYGPEMANKWGDNEDGHFRWCMSSKNSSHDDETHWRDDEIKKCKADEPVVPPQSTAPQQNPSQTTCKVTVIISNGVCQPDINTPVGANTTYGCGTTEDIATANAAARYYSEHGTCLVETPTEGCCTYTKQVVQGCQSCPQSTMSYKHYPPCSGLRPVGTAPYCCPIGSAYRNGFCLHVKVTGRPKDTPTAPPATPESCRAGMVGTPPNCTCPPGTHLSISLHRCLQASTPTAPPPPPATPEECRLGMVGKPPNCACPAGTRFSSRFHRCLHASTPTPTPVPVGPSPQQKCPSYQVGTFPNCHCPSGTSGSRCQDLVVH